MNAHRTYAESALRLEAFTILESIEELVWASSRRNETVPQTRLYYEKVLAGYDPSTPRPLYVEAVWGDEAPPAPDVGVDPRSRRRVGGSADGEVKREDDVDGDAAQEGSSSGESGRVRIKDENLWALEQKGARDANQSSSQSEIVPGDKRKRVRKGPGGQSPRMPGR